LLALLVAHHIFHVSRIRVKQGQRKFKKKKIAKLTLKGIVFYFTALTAQLSQCSNRLKAEMSGFSFFAVSPLFLFAASFLSVTEPNSSAIERAYWDYSFRGKSAEA